MGWYVRNVKDLVWHDRAGFGIVTTLVEDDAAQLGVNLFVLRPGDVGAMYHWEEVQEDFLVLSGEATVIVDGEERPLKAWDFVHCPPKVAHTFVGTGPGPVSILAIGGRSVDGAYFYPLDDVAAKYGAASPEETGDQDIAYARMSPSTKVSYGGWLDE